ncbi:MAG TPA: cob(I)yrinic acid a,c-diamide adenosyltransferase [Candidatus Dormibacteraeota bacterium]|jgi:cob(I)alamin adenosyltransferase|nr:cob(I)yrinic acid a,c-diamide adenosyltransferase [Candidatus Dormibacteraeota bacterium]
MGSEPRKTRKTRKTLRDTAGSGDAGTTGLLGPDRVSKDHPVIEAVGTVDEASSALGLARALSSDARSKEICEELQRTLYRVGAELASAPGEVGSWGVVSEADVEGLESLMTDLEAEVPMQREFVLPGRTPGSGAIDLARAIVRRAERRVVLVRGSGRDVNPQLLRYLNRLSLLLFVLGRFEENRAGIPSEPARPPKSRA